MIGFADVPEQQAPVLRFAAGSVGLPTSASRYFQPIQASALLARELASQTAAETGALVGAYREDPHPSRILRERSRGHQRRGELYDEMRASDTDLAGFIRKRSDAVLQLPRRIVPANGTPEAAAVAAACQAALGAIPNLSGSLAHLLRSRADGIAFLEIVWTQPRRGPLAGLWTPLDLIDRPMHRFLFRDGALFVRQALSAAPIAAPPGKFVVMRYGTKDNPWGGPSLLDEVYWYWHIKRDGLKFYAGFLERWAQPLAVGKYPHRRATTGDDNDNANRADQQTLLETLQAIQTEMAIVLPEHVQIDLLEATRSGAATYEQFVAMLTRSEALAFLGEVDTSGAAKGPGSFAKAEVSNSVRLEKVLLDAHDLAVHVREQLLRPFVELNFGYDVEVPRLVIDTWEAEDRAQRLSGISALLADHQPVPRRYYYLTAQVPEPEDGEPVVERSPPALPPPPSPAPAAPPEPPPAEPTNQDAAPPSPAEPPHPAEPATLSLAADGAIGRDLAEAMARADARQSSVDELAALSVPRTLQHYANLEAIISEAWDVGAVEAGTALQFLVARWDSRQHADALQTSIIHALGVATRDLAAELPGGLLRFALPPGVAAATTPATARELWAKILDFGRDVLAGLADLYAGPQATASAATNDAQTLLEVADLLTESQVDGVKRPDFVRRLNDLLAGRGLTPANPWHAELIHHQALRNAAAIARWRNTVGNPAAHRLLPYLRYLTLDDAHVRPKHQLLHGKIFAINHPIWREIFPPWEFGCRCDVETINSARARQLGLTGSEPTGPWPELDGQPLRAGSDYISIADLAGGQQAVPAPASNTPPSLPPSAAQPIGQIADRAKASGNSDLIAALSRLLIALIGTDFGLGGT